MGLVEGSINELRQGLQTLTSEIRVRDGDAKAGRRELHLKMDKMTAEFTVLSNEFYGLKAEVGVFHEEIGPKAKHYWDLWQRIRGGIWVAGILLMIVFTALGFAMRDVWAWLWSHVAIK